MMACIPLTFVVNWTVRRTNLDNNVLPCLNPVETNLICSRCLSWPMKMITSRRHPPVFDIMMLQVDLAQRSLIPTGRLNERKWNHLLKIDLKAFIWGVLQWLHCGCFFWSTVHHHLLNWSIGTINHVNISYILANLTRLCLTTDPSTNYNHLLPMPTLPPTVPGHRIPKGDL